MNDQKSNFEQIFDLAKPKLPNSVELLSAKGTKSGGALCVLHDERWCDPARHVTVHLELIASNRIALHVETYPYQNKDPQAMDNKNALLKKVRAVLFGFAFDGYKEYGPRNGWGTHDSSAVGYVKIDAENVGYSSMVLARLYVALEPYIDPLF